MYQLSQEEEKLVVNYLDPRIKKGEICSSHRTVGSPI
jgi:hypothetical protein